MREKIQEMCDIRLRLKSKGNNEQFNCATSKATYFICLGIFLSSVLLQFFSNTLYLSRILVMRGSFNDESLNNL